jgi:hypothetical protein
MRWAAAAIVVVGFGACSSQNGTTADAGPDSTASDGAGNDVAPLGDASCDGPCNTIPAGLLDPDYTTNWNPGILADTATNAPLGDDGLPVRTTV